MNKKLYLAVDMNGCPNRCAHCWLGHMPNKNMDSDIDVYLVEYFRPYFDTVVYYSWLREPDFCENYDERWRRDNLISIGEKPVRFELASFWRLVRDRKYVYFLKDVGVTCVQLTFFGLKGFTDRYVGRKGSFEELIRATEILVEHEIAPRWQVFINEENKDEIVSLWEFSKQIKLEERCLSFGQKFRFFVHAGSAEGENRKLYNIRICKEHIPNEVIPLYLDYDKVCTESELCKLLAYDDSHITFRNDDKIVLNISNELDVFFNYTHMIGKWKIGNIKQDPKEVLIERVLSERIPALELSDKITVSELIKRYGDMTSHRVFTENDYKTYLLNCYLDES